ncbi:MAG: glutamine-hydrolyzing synthase, partial [Belnapia sp.]|nr:glutamine-hydrolyzing synthase [Belnapia sp.]
MNAPPTSSPLATAVLHDRILILDFGSQVTQLIARRLRESGVYCEVWPYTADPARIEAFAPRGIILSGGPASVTEGSSPRAPQDIFGMGLPILGICYGQQTMAHQLGGVVEGGHAREFGRAFIEVTGDCAITQGVWAPGAREQVWMSHGDRITELPSGFRVVAASGGAPFALIADDARHFYGTMFHPEVV